ncbi:MAG: hypothetical protein KDK39_09820 [Leptospiraceae bacterium]|nr:hypothetical protein [Leptospiraceae bacterium]
METAKSFHWQRFAGKYNASLRLNRKGQIEVLAHIESGSEIDDLCAHLAAKLKQEWDVIQARPRIDHGPDEHQSQSFLFDDPDQPATPLLRPVRATAFKDIPVLLPPAGSMNTERKGA